LSPALLSSWQAGTRTLPEPSPHFLPVACWTAAKLCFRSSWFTFSVRHHGFVPVVCSSCRPSLVLGCDAAAQISSDHEKLRRAHCCLTCLQLISVNSKRLDTQKAGGAERPLQLLLLVSHSHHYSSSFIVSLLLLTKCADQVWPLATTGGRWWDARIIRIVHSVTTNHIFFLVVIK
ncbi:unnamed protein product, partial [Heterosigma akashiwo]